jgi:hypothetical protein
VTVHSYETQRASWTERCSAQAAAKAVSGRVKTGRLVDKTEAGLTVEYGSPAKFRVMGGMLTSRWFPLTAEVTITGHGDTSEVEVVGTDQKGAYLADISIRRGERSIGKRVRDL